MGVKPESCISCGKKTKVFRCVKLVNKRLCMLNKLPCRYIFGYRPIETGWCTNQLVYTAPDGRCFNFFDGKAEHIGTVDEIEKDRTENDGRFFGHLTPVENLGEHAPADEKLYMYLGIQTFEAIINLEAELPPDCGYNFERYLHTSLPIVHPWGRARIDLKHSVEPLQRSIVHELVRFSTDLLREEAIARAHRAAQLAWAIEPSHEKAWALVLRTADESELKNLKEDIILLHKGSTDKPDDPELFSRLDWLADHLLYD